MTWIPECGSVDAADPERPLTRRTLLARAVLAGCIVSPLAVARPRGLAPRDVVNAYFTAVATRDVESLMGHLSGNAVYEDVPFAYRVRGAAAIRSMLTGALASLDPVERRILRVAADERHVVVEWSTEGRHAGPMLGTPASGRTLRFQTLTWFEVVHERIVRITDYTDRTALEAQLKAPG